MTTGREGFTLSIGVESARPGSDQRVRRRTRRRVEGRLERIPHRVPDHPLGRPPERVNFGDVDDPLNRDFPAEVGTTRPEGSAYTD